MATSPAAVGALSILKAATALFAEEGFDGASVAAIAERAGVCKANVFHHFPSKEDLYFAVIKEATRVHADYAEELYRVPGSSAEKVRKMLEFGVHDVLTDRLRFRLLLREIADSSRHARGRKLARMVFQRNFSALVSLFEQGRQSGEFDAALDPAASAMLLIGSVHSFFYCREVLREFREASGLETPEAYIERISTLILACAIRRDTAQGAVAR